MSTPTPSPNYRTGKICYIEIPAIDISNDGSTAFDDTIGEVSGTWVLGRPPSNDPGLLVSIMVASAATTIETIIAAGGEIVQPVNPDEHEVYALFRDPAGNILGIYQQPGLAEIEARR
ncbi:MAG: glyoxalase [Ktedonobacter sp. 13_1_20CM_3_54_15]|nr:MAG: glyoxalase [Ktedonobacter sp. 13_1_20CM_3_54_15]